MVIKLSTTVTKINFVSNADNSRIIRDFYEYMKANGTSENYQNQNLKAMIVFANFLGSDTNFFDIKTKQQVLAFLDTRIRNTDIDPDKKWITTWNDYLWRIKYFLRWLHNHKDKEQKGMEPLQQSDWTTLPFSNFKKKKTKRISPYLESELWERDDIVDLRRSYSIRVHIDVDNNGKINSGDFITMESYPVITYGYPKDNISVHVRKVSK